MLVLSILSDIDFPDNQNKYLMVRNVSNKIDNNLVW